MLVQSYETLIDGQPQLQSQLAVLLPNRPHLLRWLPTPKRPSQGPRAVPSAKDHPLRTAGLPCEGVMPLIPRRAEADSREGFPTG